MKTAVRREKHQYGVMRGNRAEERISKKKEGGMRKNKIEM